MKSNKLLSLPFMEQENWLQNNVTDFDHGGYLGNVVGYIDFIDAEYEIEPYINDPEGYKTGGIIKPFLTEMTSDREEAINLGSPITDKEKEILKNAVMKIVIKDPERELLDETTFSGFPFSCEDGEVFVLFSGQRLGIGNYSWEFHSIYNSEEEAIKGVSQDLDENEYFVPC
jgi:hypothetical protein